MSHNNVYSFHPDLGIDAELAGIAHAHEIANAVSAVSEEERGRPLDTDEMLMVQDMLAAGLAHFHSVAEQAGRLAAEGDFIGAISMMGGIEHARELVGDEIVDNLLAEMDDSLGVMPSDFE